MKTRTEYPAGHSVDTEWFAMDKDGHIAMFGSGETGWLPAEYDTNTHWSDDIITDALYLNSTPLSDGIRKLALPDEIVSFLQNDMDRQGLASYADSWFEEESEHQSKRDYRKLDEVIIELCNGCNFTDLSVWKERIYPEETLVYQLSEDATLYLIVSLEFPKCVLNEDVESGKIIGATYFDEGLFCFDYSPKDCYSMDAEMVEDEYSRRKGCSPLAFKLPKGFHNMKTLDVSFAESKELNLDELMGMYVLDLECDTADINHFVWPYYYAEQQSDLEKNLFVAIEEMRSRTVWCLIDRYHIRPDVFSKTRGKTAIQFAMELYEKYKDDYSNNSAATYSSYRILKMLQLKEKQLKQKGNNHA